MKIKFITSASDSQHPGWKHLERSLNHFGWKYSFLEGPWVGYAGKMLYPYSYLKEGHESATDLIMLSDAYDSFFLCSPEEVVKKYMENFAPKILYYAERACWPHGHLESQYPPCDTPYKHLNGGGFIGTVADYLKLVELDPPVPSAEYNDQVWSTNIFLNKNSEANIELDHHCKIFQCLAHYGPTDFKEEGGRLINNITGTTPCVIHGNGHTKMDHIWDLIK